MAGASEAAYQLLGYWAFVVVLLIPQRCNSFLANSYPLRIVWSFFCGAGSGPSVGFYPMGKGACYGAGGFKRDPRFSVEG